MKHMDALESRWGPRVAEGALETCRGPGKQVEILGASRGLGGLGRGERRGGNLRFKLASWEAGRACVPFL